LPGLSQFNKLRGTHNSHAIVEIFTLQYKQQDLLEDQWLKLPDNMEPKLVMLLNNYRIVLLSPSHYYPHEVINMLFPWLVKH